MTNLSIRRSLIASLMEEKGGGKEREKEKEKGGYGMKEMEVQVNLLYLVSLAL